MSAPQGPANANAPQQPSSTVAPTGSAVPRPAFVPRKYDLPMLDNDRDNYKLWCKALTLALRNCRLWHIINRMDTAPNATSDPDTHNEWCLKDQEAQLTILLVLKKVSQKCVYQAKTSKDCWDRLAS
jgi:hypothetical protein